MAVTATILECWQLVENDVQLRQQKRREVDVANRVVRGWLEQCDMSSIQIKAHFVGLTGFTDQTGAEQVGFSYHVGRGDILTFYRTGGLKYLCTRDRINIEDHVDGEGWEYQTWERISKWEVVPGSYYEDPIPEQGEAYEPGDEPDPEPDPEP